MLVATWAAVVVGVCGCVCVCVPLLDACWDFIGRERERERTSQVARC